MDSVKRNSRQMLLAQIEALHVRMIERCFNVAKPELFDQRLAERYCALIESLTRLPREQLLALKVIAASAGRETETAYARPSSTPARWEAEELVLFRRLAARSGFGFGIADLKGNITYINPALCRMLGESTPEETLGKSVYAYYLEDDADALMKRIIPATLEEGQWSGEISLVSTSGELIPTIQNIFLVHGEPSEPPYLANLIIDITRRKRAERALRESETKHKTLIHNIPGMVYRGRTDWSAEIISGSEALCGYNPEELNSRPEKWLGLIHPDDRERVFQEGFQLLSQQEAIVQVYRIRHKDGRWRWVEDHKTSLFSEDGKLTGIDGVVFDISDRKQAEGALKSREANFRALAENASDGILIAAADGVHVFANQRAAQITGYDVDELIGLDFRRLAHPDEVERLSQRFKQRLAGEDVPHHYETRILNKDGAEVPIELTAAVTIWQGAPADIVVIRDVTERKRADAALRASEEKYRDLVENLDEVIFTFDAEGAVTYVSPSIESHLGYRPSDIVGHAFTEFLHSDHVKHAREAVEKVLGGEPAGPNVYQLVNKAGEIRWIRAKGVPIYEGDRVTGVRGVMTDITDSRRTEEALRESEKQYATLFESAHDGVVLVQDRVICLANPATAEISGYSRDELMGKPFIDLVAPEDREMVAERHLRRLAGEPVPPVYSTRIVRKDGVTVDLEVAASVIEYNGRTAILAVARDITDRQANV